MAALGLRRRVRRRLARARWTEYRRFIEGAIDEGYRIEPLDRWIRDPAPPSPDARVLVIRHDVDQQPGSVRPMAQIEHELGVRTTWYFRWRTADPEVIAHLHRIGHTTGLHYETLTRRAHRLRLKPSDPWEHLVESCRAELTQEIALWARHHGRARSVCPHGDTGVPWLTNAILMRGRRAEDFGVEFDSNEAMRDRDLGHWLTDRSVAEGGWKDGVRPAELLAGGVSPILAVVHPNNWSSGISLLRTQERSDEPADE